MKKLTLSLLCAGLIATVAMAEDMCNATYQAGNYTQSEQCYIKQLKTERSYNNLFRAGVSLAKQQRYQEALPYLIEAEKKASSLGDFAAIYSWLGAIYNNLGNSKQTYAYLMKQLEINLKLGDTNNIATSYNNLGLYYQGEAQPKKALEFYEKALNYKEESQKGTIYNNLAFLYENMGDVKKAEEMYLKAIVNDEKSGNYTNLGIHKSNLGIFYFNQSRYNEAKVALNEALVIAQKQGLKETEANTLEALAAIEKAKK
ncbi:MAG: tetratricopeptide repeat protein [Sulfurimonas sp.]|jgi:tetratricopeptide (TPR) repeat protein